MAPTPRTGAPSPHSPNIMDDPLGDLDLPDVDTFMAGRSAYSSGDVSMSPVSDDHSSARPLGDADSAFAHEIYDPETGEGASDALKAHWADILDKVFSRMRKPRDEVIDDDGDREWESASSSDTGSDRSFKVMEVLLPPGYPDTSEHLLSADELRELDKQFPDWPPNPGPPRAGWDLLVEHVLKKGPNPATDAFEVQFKYIEEFATEPKVCLSRVEQGHLDILGIGGDRVPLTDDEFTQRAVE